MNVSLHFRKWLLELLAGLKKQILTERSELTPKDILQDATNKSHYRCHSEKAIKVEKML